MEPNVESVTPEPARAQPNPASATHQPRVAVPVMDVVPPPASTEAKPAAVVASAPMQARVSEAVAVTPAPGETGDDLLASEIQASEAAPVDTKPAHAALPPKRHNSAMTAIVTTIITVVVLSALSVFAYLQSH